MTLSSLVLVLEPQFLLLLKEAKKNIYLIRLL